MEEKSKSSQLKSLIFPPIQSSAPDSGAERRDAAEHRKRILDVALTLFTEQGVDQVSMHQIAIAAGVGQGTLYRRYAHKGLLCTALLYERIIHFQEELLAYLTKTGEDLPALDRLNAMLLRLIDFNEANAPLLSAITDAASGQRRNNQYQSPFYLWLRVVVALLLRRAVEREEIAELDIEYAADIVLLPLAIDFYLYQRQLPGFTPKRIASGLQQFLSHGLNALAK